MDNVLADKPSTQPSTLIDTSISSNDGTPEPCPEPNEDNDAEGGNADNNDALSSAAEIPIGSHSDENDNTITTSDESISDKDAATTSKVEKGQFRSPIQKSKKRTSEDRFEQIMKGMFDGLLKAHELNGERFLALEEKCLKLEEQIKKNEEKLRKEEKEFQMMM